MRYEGIIQSIAQVPWENNSSVLCSHTYLCLKLAHEQFLMLGFEFNPASLLCQKMNGDIHFTIAHSISIKKRALEAHMQGVHFLIRHEIEGSEAKLQTIVQEHLKDFSFTYLRQDREVLQGQGNIKQTRLDEHDKLNYFSHHVIQCVAQMLEGENYTHQKEVVPEFEQFLHEQRICVQYEALESKIEAKSSRAIKQKQKI